MLKAMYKKSIALFKKQSGYIKDETIE